MYKSLLTDEGVELDGTLTNEDTVTDKTIEKTANHSGRHNISREFVDEKASKKTRDEDPVLAKKPDPCLCTSNEGRFLKVYFEYFR